MVHYADIAMRKFALVALFLGVTSGWSQTPAYKGPGSCNGSSCHGNTRAAPESESAMLGNEYATWASRRRDGSVVDKHSGAYAVLANDRSRRMAKLLDDAPGNRAKIGDPQNAPRCLACHSVGSPQKADGVSCEACHGPSAAWLGPHTAANSHAASVQAGMVETKDLVTRSKICLECHLGTTKERRVDHELIAAGHPDLAFELDTFSAAMPMHWRDPKPSAGNTAPRARVWAVGQAVALAEGMKMLAADADGANWPEFSHLECYQCHHDLRADSWRIQQGYGGRKPGTLQPNLARFEVLRVLVGESARDRRDAFESAFTALGNDTSAHIGDGKAIAGLATTVERQASALAVRFTSQDFTAESMHAIIRALAAESPRIARSGVHSAEQLTMALDSLSAASSVNRASSIDALYDYLEHPSVYQPQEFAALFRKAAAIAAP